MLKFYKQLIIICFNLCSVALFSQVLSFSEAEQTMYKQNILLKAVEKQHEVHKFDFQSKKGLRYPSVGVFGAGFYLDKEIGANLNGFRNELAGLFMLPDPGLLGNWNFTLLKRGIAFGGVDFLYPIFTGGKINAAIEAAKIKMHIGEKEIVNTQNKLISELAQNYFQVKLAEEALEVRKQVLNGMKKHLYDAEKLEKEGIIAPVEKLQANVAVSEANRQYMAAKKDIELARIALANTLGIDKLNSELITDFFLIPNLKPLEYYQESAVANYPEIQKLGLQIDLAEQGIKVKKSSYYPTIETFGGAILLHNNPIGIAPVDDRPWAIGIGLTYTLFSGFQGKNEIKSAIATKQSVELYQTKIRKDIKMLVEKLYQDLQKHEEQIQNLEIQKKQGEELIRVRTKAFSEGIATSTEVIDASINLSAIKLQSLKEYFQYIVSLASMLEYSGLSKEFTQYTN